jgi:hypothetical protein
MKLKKFKDKGIRSIANASDTSFAVGYSSVEMFIFSMSRLKIRMAAWGNSNIVFRSDVSIGHVVATAGNLKSKLKTSEIKQEISTVADSCNDDQILHAAIRILRRDIEKINHFLQLIV